MKKSKVPEIKLTDDTIKNIQIMAPLLDKESQNQVLVYMMGIARGMNLPSHSV